ncbi:hypothetical protein [Nocardia sp. NPDC050406]|uniref:hypothetical protein n=1 Tax=Nocardia sp. NPDC050406 TaxID=3364318 RepID=UPI0037A771AE
MDVIAARKCAANFLRFAHAIDTQLPATSDLQSLTGFGGFESAHQLRRGFEGKAAEATEILTGLRTSAVRIAQAFLLSGGLIEEADTLTAKSLQAALADLETPR